jgi:hypothetical protein
MIGGQAGRGSSEGERGRREEEAGAAHALGRALQRLHRQRLQHLARVQPKHAQRVVVQAHRQEPARVEVGVVVNQWWLVVGAVPALPHPAPHAHLTPPTHTRTQPHTHNCTPTPLHPPAPAALPALGHWRDVQRRHVLAQIPLVHLQQLALRVQLEVDHLAAAERDGHLGVCVWGWVRGRVARG